MAAIGSAPRKRTRWACGGSDRWHCHSRHAAPAPVKLADLGSFTTHATPRYMPRYTTPDEPSPSMVRSVTLSMKVGVVRSTDCSWLM